MGTFPLVGPSYTDRSRNFDCQRSVNLYPIKSESGTSKAITALQGTPGLLTFSQPLVEVWETNAGPARGCRLVIDRCFFVINQTLYEVLSDGSNINRGELITTTGTVSMSDNGLQLIMVDGLNGYVFTLADNSFVLITSTGFLGATTVTYCDGYFILNKPDSGIYYISALNDGTTYDPLDFASAEGTPDNLIAVAAVHGQVWLLGSQSVEVVYDSGNVDFPFQNVQGVFIQYGCIAPYSVVTTSNTIFWVGADKDGSGIVWMANAYQPQRISTSAIEYAIQQYGDISNTTAYTYQEDGHYFYALNFPNANITWVYDIGTQQWHERGYFNTTTGLYERHRAECHVFAFGKHLVGDYETGLIYEQSLDIYDDNGNPKRWMRACPHIADDLEYIYYNKLQVDMQTGVGLTTGNAANVSPQVMLQWSDDGGYTWSNEHWVSIGAIGNYATRALWRRLGRSRDRVFRIAGAFNSKVCIIAGHITPVPGTN